MTKKSGLGILSIGGIGALIFSLGCSNDPTASAKILDNTGAQIGSASFVEKSGSVSVDVQITKSTPGKHGLHIHAEGKCDPPDFTTAGGHFNPGGTSHGDPASGAHHAGDFGNLEVMTVGQDGTGRVQITTAAITLAVGAANSIVGKAIIFHAGQDDFTTQPTGNSGGRTGCGLIQAGSQ